MLDRSLIAVTDVLATVPNVMFSIKDVELRYVMVNQAFADRAGVAGPGDVVGGTAHDFFPAELAASYEAQDAALLTSGQMLTNEVEVIPQASGDHGWFLTSKSRWTDEHGAPVGIVSTSADLRASIDRSSAHGHLVAAVEVARARAGEQVRVVDLAEAAGMSQAQLERTMRKVTGLTPKQLLMRFRLERALHLLDTTDLGIGEIAAASGYYDQSAFTRHFRRVVGVPPGRYRNVVRPD